MGGGSKVGCLSVSFLRLFRKVPNKNVSVKKCYDPMENGVSWDVSFRRGLCWHEVVEYEYLLSILSNIFICTEEKYCRIGNSLLLESSL